MGEDAKKKKSVLKKTYEFLKKVARYSPWGIMYRLGKRSAYKKFMRKTIKLNATNHSGIGENELYYTGDVKRVKDGRNAYLMNDKHTLEDKLLLRKIPENVKDPILDYMTTHNNVSEQDIKNLITTRLAGINTDEQFDNIVGILQANNYIIKNNNGNYNLVNPDDIKEKLRKKYSMFIDYYHPKGPRHAGIFTDDIVALTGRQIDNNKKYYVHVGKRKPKKFRARRKQDTIGGLEVQINEKDVHKYPEGKALVELEDGTTTTIPIIETKDKTRIPSSINGIYPVNTQYLQEKAEA